MKGARLLIVGFGVVMICLGLFVGPSGEVRTVDVCVSDGEQPGPFDNCPTVEAQREVEGTGQMTFLILGSLVAVGGLLLGPSGSTGENEGENEADASD